MYEIAMQLPFNGYHVEGKLCLPVKAKSLIIFSHGVGRSSLMPHERKLALRFQQEKFGTLAFDTYDSRQEIPNNAKGLELLSKGLIAATNWLHSHSEYQKFDLGYLGSETGAATALKTASELGDTIKAVISLGGRLNLVKSELSKVRCPTLLMVGELDSEVVGINKEALSHLSAQKHLEIIPGASHLFEESEKLNEAAHIAVSWFNKYLMADKPEPKAPSM